MKNGQKTVDRAFDISSESLVDPWLKKEIKPHPNERKAHD
jgi:hypothetical protein